MKNISTWALIISAFVFFFMNCEKEEKEENGIHKTLIVIPVDFSSIQNGIDSAMDGDTILIDTGIYNEVIDLKEKSLFLTSKHLYNNDTGYISRTVLEASGYCGNVVYIENCLDTAIINGITIAYGFPGCDEDLPDDKVRGGGICVENSNLRLSNLIVKGNSAFRPNATGKGGGIYAFNSNIELKNSEIIENSAVSGGGLYIEDSFITINNCLISKNDIRTSEGDFPGIVLVNTSFTIENSTFSDNINQNNSFLINGFINCTGQIINSIFENDTVSFSDSDIEIINTSFIKNPW